MSKKTIVVDSSKNPFALDLDREGEGLEGFFHIAPERGDELIDAILALEAVLRAVKQYTPIRMLHDILHSDIAKNQEELLFLACAASSLVAMKKETFGTVTVENLTVNDMPVSPINFYEKKYKKAD